MQHEHTTAQAAAQAAIDHAVRAQTTGHQRHAREAFRAWATATAITDGMRDEEPGTTETMECIRWETRAKTAMLRARAAVR